MDQGDQRPTCSTRSKNLVIDSALGFRGSDPILEQKTLKLWRIVSLFLHISSDGMVSVCGKSARSTPASTAGSDLIHESLCCASCSIRAGDASSMEARRDSRSSSRNNMAESANLPVMTVMTQIRERRIHQIVPRAICFRTHPISSSASSSSLSTRSTSASASSTMGEGKTSIPPTNYSKYN